MKRIYLCGPVTGMPLGNARSFNVQAERLRALGYEVVNPIEICDETENWVTCMRRCVGALAICDTLALLPGWTESRGARIERHLALDLEIPAVYAADITALIGLPHAG